MAEGRCDSSIPVPPVWAERFHSDDLDEVRAFVARSAGEHSRVAHRAGALGWDLAWVAGAGGCVWWGHVDIDKTVRGMVPDPTLHLVVPAGTDYLVGRRRHATRTGTVTFLAPGWEFTRRSPGGASVAFSVNSRRLADELMARDPEHGLPTFRTRPAVLDDGFRNGLANALRDFVDSRSPGHEHPDDLHGGARLVSAMAALLLRGAGVTRAQPVASMRLTRLEDWIHNHLDQPITVGRLCEVAGVGERSLQKAFEARRGMSPMRYVTERRLSEARRRLEKGTPHFDVTRVALSLGFHHMGRFAREYRQAFGETPSQTRTRSRH
jgi:AraC-like DNA-binding protein